MASNFSFGLVVFSEANEILVLLAQIIIVFPLYSNYFGLVATHFECKALITIIVFAEVQ